MALVWESISPLPGNPTPGNAYVWCGIYAGDQYLMMGERIYTSPDAVTWTQRPFSSADFDPNENQSTNWHAVTYHAGMYVAVSDWGIGYSTDGGVTWTKMDTSTGLDYVGYYAGFVHYGGSAGVFCITRGQPGGSSTDKFWTSPDGINWTARGDPFTGLAMAVAASPSLFMVVTNYTQLFTSPDGQTWTEGTYPSFFITKMTYGDDGYFYALGMEDTYGSFHVGRTLDGNTWEIQDPFDNFGASASGDLNHSADLTVFGCSSDAGVAGAAMGIYESADFSAWEDCTPVVPLALMHTMLYDGTKFVVFGSTVLAAPHAGGDPGPPPSGLVDNFTGSGNLDNRTPDTAGWVPGGIWDGNNGLSTIASSVLATSPDASDNALPDVTYPINDTNIQPLALPGSESGWAVEMRARWVTAPVGGFANPLFFVKGHNQYQRYYVFAEFSQTDVYLETRDVNGSGDTAWADASYSLDFGTWYVFKLDVKPDGYSEFSIDGEVVASMQTDPYNDMGLKFLRFWAANGSEIDYITTSGHAVPITSPPAFWTDFAGTYEVL